MSNDPSALDSPVLLRRLEESLAGQTGRAFFLTLARVLAEALSANCAFVCEFADDNTRACPLAFWLGGDYIDVEPYPLAGTPCECVLAGEVVAFPRDVAGLFADHRDELEAIDAESYIAIPMKTRRGRVIGHIAVIDVHSRDWADVDVDVLRLCSSRASGELEHEHAQRALAAANLALEDRVRERTRELERAYEDMEQRIAERTSALAAVNARLRHEVAARAEAENALRRQEEAYRDLYENAPNVYWSTGADGLIKRANQRAEKVFGYPRAELIGKRYMELVAPGVSGAEKAQVVFGRFLEGRPTFDEELEFRAADGRSIWANVSVVPILDDDGKPIATRSVLDDITERKRAEDALNRRLDLERLIAEVATGFAGARPEVVDAGLAHAIARIGAWGGWDSIRVFLSAAEIEPQLAHEWQRGPSPGATAPIVPCGLIGNVDAVLDVPDVDDLDEGDLQAYLRGAGAGAVIIVPVANSTGVLGFIELVCIGRPHAWLPEDVQLLRLLGEIIASTLQRCEAERELERARIGAEAASQAKSEFLARMSHELRTPLNAILGYAQLMQRDPSFDGGKRAQIETIRRSGEHLLTLINEVLDLAKIEAGKLDVRDVDVDLRSLVGDIDAMFKSRADQAAQRFECRWIEPLPRIVVADDRRLRQILINLLGNAVKFTPCGGAVTLSVSGEKSSQREWRVTFTIDDTGVGIAADEIERIFEPFYQVGAKAGEGMGLGLAITHRLIGALHGEVEIESTPGLGSSFRVRVPITESVRADIGTAASPRITGFNGAARRILVADDDEQNRAVLGNLLRPLGFDVEEVGDGLSALAAAADRPPALLLIDLVMPKLDGLEAVQRIRARPEGAELKVIAVSASAFEQTHRHAIASGCDAFLSKPIDLDDALRVIGRLLGIQWSYAEPAQPTRRPGRGHAVPVSVPADRLAELYELARAGDVVAIEACLGGLDVEERHRAFVADLRALTGSFDLRGVQTYLAPFVDRHAPTDTGSSR